MDGFSLRPGFPSKGQGQSHRRDGDTPGYASVAPEIQRSSVRPLLVRYSLRTEQQSFVDPLTEIYNRRSLDQMAGQFISRARRRKTALSFLMVDANNFKEINTRFGHLPGDFFLAEIAEF